MEYAVLRNQTQGPICRDKTQVIVIPNFCKRLIRSVVYNGAMVSEKNLIALGGAMQFQRKRDSCVQFNQHTTTWRGSKKT